MLKVEQVKVRKVMTKQLSGEIWEFGMFEVLLQSCRLAVHLSRLLLKIKLIKKYTISLFSFFFFLFCFKSFCWGVKMMKIETAYGPTWRYSTGYREVPVALPVFLFRRWALVRGWVGHKRSCDFLLKETFFYFLFVFGPSHCLYQCGLNVKGPLIVVVLVRYVELYG